MYLETRNIDIKLNEIVYNPYIIKAVLSKKGLNLTRIASRYNCQTLHDLLSLETYSIDRKKLNFKLLALQEAIWANIEGIKELSALLYEPIKYPQITRKEQIKSTLSKQLYDAYKQMLHRLFDIYSYFPDNRPLTLYIKRLGLILDDKLLKEEKNRTTYPMIWKHFGIEFNYHNAFSQGIFTPTIRVSDNLIRRIKRKYGKELSHKSYQQIIENEDYPYLILYLYKINLPFKQRQKLSSKNKELRKLGDSYTEIVTSHIQLLKVFTIEELKASLASDGYHDIPHAKIMYIVNQVSIKSPSITPHEYVYLRYETEYHKLYWQAKERYLDLSKWIVLESVQFLKTRPNKRANYTDISLHLYKKIDSIEDRPGLEYITEYIQAYMIGLFDDLFQYTNNKEIKLSQFALSLSDMDTKDIIYKVKAHRIYRLIAEEVYKSLKESYTQEMSLTRLKKTCMSIYPNISSLMIHKAVNYYFSDDYYRYTKDRKVIYGLQNPYKNKQLHQMFSNMERNIDKVIAFIRVLDISISSFCRLIDINESYFSKCQKEGNDLSEKTILKIQTLFPELSKVWFQDKRVSIINPYATDRINMEHDSSIYSSNYKINIDDFEHIKDYQVAQEYLSKKRPANGEKYLYILNREYKIISLDIGTHYEENKLYIDSHVIIDMDLIIHQELTSCLLNASIIGNITIICKDRLGKEVYSYSLSDARLYSININHKQIDKPTLELSIYSNSIKMNRL